MTVFTLGQASAQALCGFATQSRRRSGAPRRTGATVRRDSLEAGSFEEMFFCIPAKGETDRLLRTAQRTLDAARRLRRDARAGTRTLTVSERTITALTAGAVRVYEELLTLARLNRGRVYPSYDHLSEATGLGRATVARALRVLEAIGFVLRQRRFKRVAGDGPGPRYTQTSNAYRAMLPQRVLAYLPRWMRPAPLPDDIVQRETDRAEDNAAMLASLSCRELAAMTVGGPLGQALARLGAGLDCLERESHNGPQSLPQSSQKQNQRNELTGQHTRPHGQP